MRAYQPLKLNEPYELFFDLIEPQMQTVCWCIGFFSNSSQQLLINELRVHRELTAIAAKKNPLAYSEDESQIIQKQKDKVLDIIGRLQSSVRRNKQQWRGNDFIDLLNEVKKNIVDRWDSYVRIRNDQQEYHFSVATSNNGSTGAPKVPLLSDQHDLYGSTDILAVPVFPEGHNPY